MLHNDRSNSLFRSITKSHYTKIMRINLSNYIGKSVRFWFIKINYFKWLVNILMRMTSSYTNSFVPVLISDGLFPIVAQIKHGSYQRKQTKHMGKEIQWYFLIYFSNLPNLGNEFISHPIETYGNWSPINSFPQTKRELIH